MHCTAHWYYTIYDKNKPPKNSDAEDGLKLRLLFFQKKAMRCSNLLHISTKNNHDPRTYSRITFDRLFLYISSIYNKVIY